MNLKPTISVLGGDTRQYYTAKRLLDLEYSVIIYGLELCDNNDFLPAYTCLEDALKREIILLPLPFSRNTKTLNTPFCADEISISDFLLKLGTNKTVFAGMASDAFKSAVLASGNRFFDYFLSEELTVKNALLTSEGILSIMLEKLPVTINKLNVAITGYGKVGYFTAKALKSLGATVTVFARNETQLAKAECAGLNIYSLEKLADTIHSFTCLINTVPARVITGECIKKMNKSALLIETASAPYGIDFEAAAQNKIQLIKAFSLPGKTAPVTAGYIIADTVAKQLEGV